MLYDPKWEQQVEAKPLEPWQQVLLKAAEHLRKYGWIQHHAITEDGAACALGAINAQGKNGDVCKACWSLSEYLQGSVPCWNDAPGRTKAEVIAALESCALGSGKGD